METVQDYFRKLAEDTGDVTDTLIHAPRKYRSIFISDFHLGTAVCLARHLVQFLNHTDAEYLYLNGDIIDCWKIGVHRTLKFGKLFKGEHYDQAQMDVLQKIFRKGRHGTKIVLIPGNHDEVLRDFVGKTFGNIVIFFDAVHETKDGRHFLVMHGDSFDEVIRNYRQLSIFGTHAYNFAAKLSVKIDHWRKDLRINHILESLNLSSHWSLAEAIATRTDTSTYSELYIRSMMNHLFAENLGISERRKDQEPWIQEPYLSGIIGGHTHRADELDFRSPVDEITGTSLGPSIVKYLNSGHWTGIPGSDRQAIDLASFRDEPREANCTAVVEYEDGEMGHVRWHPTRGVIPFHPRSKYNDIINTSVAPLYAPGQVYARSAQARVAARAPPRAARISL